LVRRSNTASWRGSATRSFGSLSTGTSARTLPDPERGDDRPFRAHGASRTAPHAAHAGPQDQAIPSVGGRARHSGASAGARATRGFPSPSLPRAQHLKDASCRHGEYRRTRLPDRSAAKAGLDEATAARRSGAARPHPRGPPPRHKRARHPGKAATAPVLDGSTLRPWTALGTCCAAPLCETLGARGRQWRPNTEPWSASFG
jgi:hypothetical protein